MTLPTEISFLFFFLIEDLVNTFEFAGMWGGVQLV